MEYVWSIFGGSGGFVQSNTLKNGKPLLMPFSYQGNLNASQENRNLCKMKRKIPIPR